MRIGRRCIPGLTVAWLVLPAAIVLADDILDHVPADSAAVIVVRDAGRTAVRLDRIARQIGRVFGEADATPLKAEAMLRRMGIEPGWCNENEPVVLVFSRANLDEPRVAVGFTRAGQDQFASLDRPDENGSRVSLLREGDNAHGFGTRFGNLVFISTKRPTLERLSRLDRADSLAVALRPEQRKAYEGSDLWLHARIKPWLPRIEQGIDMAGMYLKLMGAMNPKDAETAGAMFDWFLDGLKSTLGQMESTDIAARFDDEGMTLTHLHTFPEPGSVSSYLGEIRQSKGDMLAGLPDEPFLIAGGSNWRGGSSVWTGVIDRIGACASVREKITPEARKALRRTIDEWYDDLRTSNFMFVTDADGNLPAEIRATYDCGDAAAAMRKFLQMQESSQEFLDYLPGGGYAGKFIETDIGGIKARELKMDFTPLDPMARAGAEIMYGRDARLIVAQVDAHRLAYVLSPRREAIRSIVGVTPERSLTRNAVVRRIRAKLAPHPHILAIVNLSGAVALAPQLAAAGPQPGHSEHERQRFKALHLPASARGAYVGWSLGVTPHAVRGDAYIAYDDFYRLMRVVRSLSFGDTDVEPAAQSQPSKPARPQPPRKASKRN